MDWEKASPAPDNYRFEDSFAHAATASGAAPNMSSAAQLHAGEDGQPQPRGRGGSGDANTGLGLGGSANAMANAKRDRSNGPGATGGPLSTGRLAQRRGQGSGMMLGGLSGGFMRGAKGKNRFGTFGTVVRVWEI